MPIIRDSSEPFHLRPSVGLETSPVSVAADAGSGIGTVLGDDATDALGASMSHPQHPLLRVLKGGSAEPRRGSELLADMYVMLDDGLAMVTTCDPDYPHLVMMRRLLEPVARREGRLAPQECGAGLPRQPVAD